MSLGLLPSTKRLPQMIPQVPKAAQGPSSTAPQTAALRPGGLVPRCPHILQGKSCSLQSQASSGNHPPLPHCVVLSVPAPVTQMATAVHRYQEQTMLE